MPSASGPVSRRSSTLTKCYSDSPFCDLDDEEIVTPLRPSEKQPSEPPWRHHSTSLIWFCKDQWFLIGMIVLVIISSQVQVPASRQSKKETVVTYLCVSVIFIITGCTLPSKTLKENYARWKIHLFVQIQCFLMCSASIYGIVSACATNPSFMDPAMLVGMIFVACVPTTISSNVNMTKQAHGNHALTVVQSTLGNLIGPFITPLLIEMYTGTGAWYTHILPPPGALTATYRRVFKQLGLSIYLPFAVGQAIQNVFPRSTKRVLGAWHLSKLSQCALLILIWQVFDSAFETGAFTAVKGDNMVFIVFISITLYLTWSAICISLSLLWLDKYDTIAVAYCVPAKTPAMGVPLSVVLFTGLTTLTKAKIQIPLVIFQGLQIAGGSLLTIPFRKWIRPEEVQEEAAAILEGQRRDVEGEGDVDVANALEAKPQGLLE